MLVKVNELSNGEYCLTDDQEFVFINTRNIQIIRADSHSVKRFVDNNEFGEEVYKYEKVYQVFTQSTEPECCVFLDAENFAKLQEAML